MAIQSTLAHDMMKCSRPGYASDSHIDWNTIKNSIIQRTVPVSNLLDTNKSSFLKDLDKIGNIKEEDRRIYFDLQIINSLFELSIEKIIFGKNTKREDENLIHLEINNAQLNSINVLRMSK